MKFNLKLLIKNREYEVGYLPGSDVTPLGFIKECYLTSSPIPRNRDLVKLLYLEIPPFIFSTDNEVIEFNPKTFKYEVLVDMSDYE